MMMMMIVVMMMMNMMLKMMDDDASDDGGDDTCFPLTETTHFVIPMREELKAATQNASGPDANKETPAATKQQKRMLQRNKVPAVQKQIKTAPAAAKQRKHLRQRSETTAAATKLIKKTPGAPK